MISTETRIGVVKQKDLKRLYWQGKQRTVSELAVLAGISTQAMRGRLWDDQGKRKWPLEKAMTTPQARQNHCQEIIHEAFGREQTLVEWCKEFNLKTTSVASRLHRGLSMEEALKRPLPVKQVYNLHGHSMTGAEWAKWLSLDGCTLRKRLTTTGRKWALDRCLRRTGSYWFPTPIVKEGGHTAVYAPVEQIARAAGVDPDDLERRMKREVREAPMDADWTPLIKAAVDFCRAERKRK